MSKWRSPGVVYNPQIPGTQDLVKQIVGHLGLGDDSLVCTIQELENLGEDSPKSDVLITVGGDGTILRAVHVAAPRGMAILGINMGRVGFMTELSAENALHDLEKYLKNDLWIEERTMLQARIERAGEQTYHALNEVVVGSSAVSRMSWLGVTIEGEPLTTYRADSVIVATATGSTGYALSAGGPVLYPRSRDILLIPVAQHFGMSKALVLPSTSKIELTVMSSGPTTIGIDGFIDLELKQGERVAVEISPRVARFLRAHPPNHYFAALTRRLGLEHGNDNYQPRS